MQALRSLALSRFGATAVQWFDDLWRYGLCSALALDWGLLVLLVALGMSYLIAATISFSTGMLVAYFGSVRFVFSDRRTHTPLAEAVGFFVIGFLGLGVNDLLLFVFVKLLGIPVGLAKAPTVIGVFTFNFLTRRLLLFSTTSRAAVAPASIALDVNK